MIWSSRKSCHSGPSFSGSIELPLLVVSSLPLTPVIPSPSVFDLADHEGAGAVAEGGIDGFAAGDVDGAAGDGGAQVVEADRHAVRQQAIAVRGEVVEV